MFGCSIVEISSVRNLGVTSNGGFDVNERQATRSQKFSVFGGNEVTSSPLFDGPTSSSANRSTP